METLSQIIEKNQTIINSISLSLSLLALIIAFITLIYTIKMFFLKKGIDVRCSYGTSSSIECDDIYINNITLENRKDKSVVIFQVFLKLGHNYYLKIEDFEHSPLIIKPSEVYYNEYDPIIFYSVSGKRIKIDNLIKNRNVDKKILLYTTDGKYEIQAYIRRDNPIILFFNNYATAIISPLRFFHRGKSYGKNIKYLVDYTDEDGKIQTLPLYKNSHRTKFRNDFVLTEIALTNKETLKQYLIKNLKGVRNIKVLDYEEGIEKRLEEGIFDKNKIIEAKYYTAFEYYFIGKLMTKIENIKLWFVNKSRHNPFIKKLKDFIS